MRCRSCDYGEKAKAQQHEKMRENNVKYIVGALGQIQIAPERRQYRLDRNSGAFQ